MPGPLGSETNSPLIDEGTLCLARSRTPGPLCATTAPPPNAGLLKRIDAQERRLAAIIHGESSALNDKNEMLSLGYAVVNRAKAWGGKSIEQMLTADPNYTYVIKDGSPRYAMLMNATEEGVEKNPGMKLALACARAALYATERDPSGGAYWWDGVDFKTNPRHPKKKDGFRYGDPSHNIFEVAESPREVVTHWMVKDAHGKAVQGKVRGTYDHVWLSTAAYGKTIFWTHGVDYLKAEGGKAYI